MGVFQVVEVKTGRPAFLDPQLYSYGCNITRYCTIVRTYDSLHIEESCCL